jgi:hypothetical protein
MQFSDEPSEERLIIEGTLLLLYLLGNDIDIARVEDSDHSPELGHVLHVHLPVLFWLAFRPVGLFAKLISGQTATFA